MKELEKLKTDTFNQMCNKGQIATNSDNEEWVNQLIQIGYDHAAVSLNADKTKLLNDINKILNQKFDLETQNKRLYELIFSLKIENIAELKASRILFKMVSKGYTHRQKNDIAAYANIVLNNDIQEKISQIKTGIKLSEEHCDKIKQGKLGKRQPQSFLDKKYKPITQLDKENNIIQEFKSIEEAEKSNTIFKRSNISCCLTGLSKTAYGFKWVYK
jgi:hypothetical protein